MHQTIFRVVSRNVGNEDCGTIVGAFVNIFIMNPVVPVCSLQAAELFQDFPSMLFVAYTSATQHLVQLQDVIYAPSQIAPGSNEAGLPALTLCNKL